MDAEELMVRKSNVGEQVEKQNEEGWSAEERNASAEEQNVGEWNAEESNAKERNAAEEKKTPVRWGQRVTGALLSLRISLPFHIPEEKKNAAVRWGRRAAGILLPFCILMVPLLSLSGSLSPASARTAPAASVQALADEDAGDMADFPLWAGMAGLFPVKELESIRAGEDTILYSEGVYYQETNPEDIGLLPPEDALAEGGADGMAGDDPEAVPEDAAEEAEPKVAIVDGEVFAISDEEEWVPVQDPLTAEELLAAAKKDGSLREETVRTNPAENEAEIYRFLKTTLGLNTAAACGILANIDAESRFNPTVEVLDTNHLLSFGLCQWNGGRYTALKEYCAAHGCDYRTVGGQLQYLQYELQHGESAALAAVKRVENTREGAFFAAYRWASLFERCASRYYEGRAKRAWNVYWGRYSGIPADQESGSLVYLNLSGNLNGKNTDSLDGFGKVDVYINGVLSARGVSDYDRAWPSGVRYELKNIQAEKGYTYLGLSAGALKGTVGTNVRLKFSGTALGVPVTVTLHPMDGAVEPSSLTVPTGEAFGSLPTPVRAGYAFGGWFAESGQRVTEKTVMSGAMAASGTMTIYARWTEIPAEKPASQGTAASTDQSANQKGAASGNTTSNGGASDKTGTAAETRGKTPTLSVESVRVAAGQAAEISLWLRNNPGLSFLEVKVGFDGSVFSLAEISGETPESLETSPSRDGNSCILLWSGGETISGDSLLATLYFETSAQAAPGTYTITASCDSLSAAAGAITVTAAPGAAGQNAEKNQASAAEPSGGTGAANAPGNTAGPSANTTDSSGDAANGAEPSGKTNTGAGTTDKGGTAEPSGTTKLSGTAEDENEGFLPPTTGNPASGVTDGDADPEEDDAASAGIGTGIVEQSDSAEEDDAASAGIGTGIVEQSDPAEEDDAASAGIGTGIVEQSDSVDADAAASDGIGTGTAEAEQSDYSTDAIAEEDAAVLAGIGTGTAEMEQSDFSTAALAEEDTAALAGIGTGTAESTEENIDEDAF